MAQLSLKTRRRLARGISARAQKGWATRNFWGNRNAASVTLLTGNAQLTWQSKRLGAPGNSDTIRYVVAGANTPLTVSVTGTAPGPYAITVNVATNGSSVATSTAREVRNAVNSDKVAGPLIWGWHPLGSDGTAVVSVVAATNLAGATATPLY